jgi:hypothetical protein
MIAIYIKICMSLQSSDGGFYPSTQRHYRVLILSYYYTATYFGRTKICNSLRITQLYITYFLLEDGHTTETCSSIVV